MMKNFIKTMLLVAFISLFFISCNHKQPDLQNLINAALKNNDSLLVVPAGNYIINKPLYLSGINKLTIKSKKPNAVQISSMMTIPVKKLICVDEKKGIYEYTDSRLIMPSWQNSFRGYAGWPEIYIDKKPLTLCRYPNKGFIKADSIIVAGFKPKDKKSKQLPPKFISMELAKNYDKNFPLYLNGYWRYKWFDEIIKVDTLNPKTGEITLSATHKYGMVFPSGGLFYALNQPEYLDTNDEYFYNPKTGTIRFIHSFSQEPNQTIQIAYQDFTLLKIENCNNIKIENINFCYHNNLCIDISNSQAVVVNSCDFYGLAKSAIKINGGYNCGVKNSSFNYVGDTVISLSGGNRDSLIKANHFVKNCSIKNFSRHITTYSPAVKLKGVGNIIAHNNISFAPHSAIIFWGNDHLIEGNKIKKVCLNTADAGAIYCGRDWTMGGNVISKNRISELGNASHHANWAIYIDDMASGISVLNNRIENCPGGILIGGGRYNRIIGNKIINCPLASLMYDARGYQNWFKKHLVNKNLSLWPRLKAVPINQPPWSERFPWLKEIYNDDPALPRGAQILDNKIVNSPPPQIDKRVYKFGKVDFKPNKQQ